ncbi:hypothetical protein ACEPAG_1589 [Sanghuangporus baumii]
MSAISNGDDSEKLTIEKDAEGKTGGFLTFTYPQLPEDTDFETYRKTDKDWKKIIQWYNGEKKAMGVENYQSLKERFVLLQWPRDPNGPPMKMTPRGKDTGNGCELWGATLYDFYRVHRIPSCSGLSTISTGSKLAAWMRDIGELDWAQNQLKQADMEEEPHQLLVYDIGEYIEVIEEQVWKGKFGKSMDIDRSLTEAGTQSLYAPSEYPAPWPVRPFSIPTARLQKKFSHSFLPRKLLVHDPWNVLAVTSSEAKRMHRDRYWCKWGTKPDIVRTYHLQLTEEASKRQNPQYIGPRPEGYTSCPVAHLYITPKRRIGEGHHSFVYQVELELPRQMLVKPKVCYQCVLEKYKGKMMAQKLGEDVEMDEEETEVDDLSIQQTYSLFFKNGEPFDENDRNDKRFEVLKYTEFQSIPPFCKHLDRGVLAPPSQRVSVTAKLSLPDDDIEAHSKHLRDEAAMYQEFPSHMFEHWNGYNILQPMHDPTPVGAVVPQFYGFYVPDKRNEPIKKNKYMSPILLLEHCGVQVDPASLTIDQRQECFSLLRRLHAAGYLHKSIYQRNILLQHGPLQESPFKRSKEHLRFRLIDFGRTKKCNTANAFHQQSSEFIDANKNLQLGYY